MKSFHDGTCVPSFHAVVMYHQLYCVFTPGVTKVWSENLNTCSYES